MTLSVIRELGVQAGHVGIFFLHWFKHILFSNWTTTIWLYKVLLVDIFLVIMYYQLIFLVIMLYFYTNLWTSICFQWEALMLQGPDLNRTSELLFYSLGLSFHIVNCRIKSYETTPDFERCTIHRFFIVPS